MRANLLRNFSAAFFTLTFFSCTKTTEEFKTDPLSSFFPTQPGKFIIYRTDSTVFTNFGRKVEIHSFQEKQIVDAQVTDNLGRVSYRVFRFFRDTLGLNPWVSAGSFFITPEKNTIEVSENNLRFLKLTLPVAKDNTWKGNRFLPSDPYSAFYNFSNDDNMDAWDYTYSNTGVTVVLNGQTIADVITIDQVNESINVPITSPTAYASINYAVDKYAKTIGLIYQELIMWEYQPNPGGPSPYQVGFGVKRSMLSHN